MERRLLDNGPRVRHRRPLRRDLHLRHPQEIPGRQPGSWCHAICRRSARASVDRSGMPGHWLGLRKAVINDTRPTVIAATKFMILTGWQRGEVLGLRWSEIDLGRRTARLTDTKTGFSMRALPIAACTVLRTLDKTDDLVFPRRIGGIMVGYRKLWLKIAKLGDLPDDITPHVLRHSFASVVGDLGYSEGTIATLIGHKGHSIT
jgi:integrase